MDGRRSTSRIAAVLREIDADVVCLQEVHQGLPESLFRDQPNRLSRLLHMPVVFQNNLRRGVGAYGNALLTRLPIRSHASTLLPNMAERKHPRLRFERRGLLEVLLDSTASPMAVLVTHWSLNPSDRKRSAEEVAERARSVQLPVILVGDFNTGPASEEMEVLRERSGLIDAAESTNQPTFPSDQPGARIDYVWHSPELTISSVRVVDTQASDHLPVVVDW